MTVDPLAGGLARRISDDKYRREPEIERTAKSYTLGLIPDSPAMTILDIGCGTGVNAAALAAKGHFVTGVDVSPVAIERFRGHGFDGHVANLEDGLPLTSKRFEVVFASEVLEHVVDTERCLAEMFRVVVPDGRLVLSTPNSAFWLYRLAGLIGLTVSELQHPGHLRFFSKSDLIRRVGAAGFEDIRVSGRHMYVLLGDQVGRRLAPVLPATLLHRERRFRTATAFWHVGGFAERASGLWADTLIVTAIRPPG